MPFVSDIVIIFSLIAIILVYIMETNSIKQQKKKSGILSQNTIHHQRHSLLNTLPVGILDHIASYLHGSDALSYAECIITKFALLAERKF